MKAYLLRYFFHLPPPPALSVPLFTPLSSHSAVLVSRFRSLFFFFTQSISFPTMPGTILRRRIVNHSRAFSTYSYANWGTLTCIYIYMCIYIYIYIDTFVASYSSIFPTYDIVSVAVRLFEASWTEEAERESDRCGEMEEKEKEVLRIKMKSLTEHSSSSRLSIVEWIFIIKTTLLWRKRKRTSN